MRRRRPARLFAVAALLFVGVPVQSAPRPTAGSAAEDARLTGWLDAQYDRYLDLAPMERTFAGDARHNDAIDDMSERGMARKLAFRARSVRAMKAAFDRATLSPDAQLSYDLWVREYEQAAADYRFRRNDYVFSQFISPQTMLPQFLTSIHRVDTPADMQGYIARIGGISRAILQDLDRAKSNAKGGVRPPRFAYDGVIEQARAMASGAPFAGAGTNPVWADAQAKVDALERTGRIDRAAADALRTRARRTLLDAWGPAYRQVVAWFEADRPNAVVTATGVGKDPNGTAYYAKQLASATTTDLTPDQVHRIGLEKVAEIRRAMEATKERVGFKGTLSAFFTVMREDPRFYYANDDAGRRQYLADATRYVTDIRAKLPRYFATVPKAGVVAMRVDPSRERPGGAQYFQAAAPDGSRPGIFYSDLSDMRVMPRWKLEATAYHEAGLGHHLQFSIAQELTGIPRFRTRLSYNAYLEGWGLYTEELGREMGGYRDPYSDFGRLSAQMWRAIRLVLDTGLHAKGWTEDRAVRYFLENSPQTDVADRVEVQRYIVAPGQATGYMIGMLKIVELRRRAERELGPKFDIRAFHDAVLGRGQLPLGLLERQVDAWIARRKEQGTG